MSTITREYEEIELSSGKIVNISVSVSGIHEANYGADIDGNRGVSRWFIDDFEFEASCEDGELDDAEQAEVAEKVEELVFDDDWDFEGEAKELDSDEDFDEGLF